VFIFIFGISTSLIFFLYNNLFLTIGQGQEIVLKKKEIAPEVLNVEQVNELLAILDKRSTTTAPINWEELTDPFSGDIPLIPTATE
jgi:hypothetical protein